MAIGIFGGSFNPVHLGHLAVAREVQDRCHIDELIFMPIGEPPHKTRLELASGQNRLTMLERAVEPYEHFSVSSYEIDKGDMSFSITTIRFMEKTRCHGAPLVFLMGLDAYLEIDTWKDYTELLDHCHLVVTSRSSLPWPEDIMDKPLSLAENPKIYRIHDALPAYGRSHGSVFFLDIPALEISASDIRFRIRNNIPVDHLCPLTVCSYIQHNKLYSERS